MSQELITFRCPSCQSPLSLPATMAGARGPCLYCQSEIIGPDPATGAPARLGTDPDPAQATPPPAAETALVPEPQPTPHPTGPAGLEPLSSIPSSRPPFPESGPAATPGQPESPQSLPSAAPEFPFPDEPPASVPGTPRLSDLAPGTGPSGQLPGSMNQPSPGGPELPGGPGAQPTPPFPQRDRTPATPGGGLPGGLPEVRPSAIPPQGAPSSIPGPRTQTDGGVSAPQPFPKTGAPQPAGPSPRDPQRPQPQPGAPASIPAPGTAGQHSPAVDAAFPESPLSAPISPIPGGGGLKPMKRQRQKWTSALPLFIAAFLVLFLAILGTYLWKDYSRLEPNPIGDGSPGGETAPPGETTTPGDPTSAIPKEGETAEPVTADGAPSIGAETTMPSIEPAAEPAAPTPLPEPSTPEPALANLNSIPQPPLTIEPDIPSTPPAPPAPEPPASDLPTVEPATPPPSPGGDGDISLLATTPDSEGSMLLSPDTSLAPSSLDLNSGDAGASPVEPAPAIDPGKTLDANSADAKILDAPIKVLRSFLAADNWQDRANYTLHINSVRPLMEAYYQSRPDAPVTATSMRFQHSEEDPETGKRFFVFHLTTKSSENGFPVLIEEDTDGLKVDWETFVEFKDALFNEFATNPSPGLAGSFHVIMRNAHFFGKQFDGLDDLAVFRLDPPIPDQQTFAFTPKTSLVNEELQKNVSWGMDFTPFVEVKWAKSPDGTDYIEVVRLLHTNWRNRSQKNL